MNLFDAIASRRSVRSYLDKPVEHEKIKSVFSAVRLAPSARNAQEWRFIIVSDPELRSRVAEAGGQPFLRQCPVIVVACALTDKRKMRCGEAAYPIDVAIAIDHLTLAAAAMGLGTCWVGSFDPDPVRTALSIPDDVPVVELLSLGYPADDGPATVNKDRLPLSEIVWENGWEKNLKF